MKFSMVQCSAVQNKCSAVHYNVLMCSTVMQYNQHLVPSITSVYIGKERQGIRKYRNSSVA